MYGRKRSLLLEPFFGLLAKIYGLLVCIRTTLFRTGILRRAKARQRVISVGNITLGGTGKTPAVIAIGHILLRKGFPPVVVSRGYGRADENKVLAVSDGNRILVDSQNGGDEPVLIGSALHGVPVVVGKDRYKAAGFAFEQFGNRVIILDDGFQHVQLRRDLDIVLIDAVDPFGRGRLFPAGILREPLAALKRAHVVLITGSDRVEDLEPLKKSIKARTQARIFTSRQAPVDLIHAWNGEVRSLAALRNTQVLAVAGIARPASFLTMLRDLGANIKAEALFSDHYRFTRSDLADIFQRAADSNISMIVTTEKDATRLKGMQCEGIWALRIELNVDEKEAWERIVSGIA